MFETTKGIISPDAGDMTGIQTWAPLMAQSIDDLLPFMWVDQTAMDDTETDNLVEGVMGYRIDQGNQAYVWTGSTWIAKPIGEVGNHLVVGSYDTTSQTDISIRRNYGGTNRDVILYNTAALTNMEYGMQLRENGVAQSRLVFNKLGDLAMDTYAGSPTATAKRPIPFATASGSVVTSGAANTTRNVSVTFPSGRFTVAPRIFVSQHTTAPQNGTPSFAGPSATSFDLYLRYATSSDITVHWFAIQMTSTSAD